MSLAIDTDEVVAVLLPDGWHTVVNNSFDFDAYEFHAGGNWNQYGPNNGQIPEVSCTGATWEEEDGARICCPAPQVVALRMRPRGARRPRHRGPGP
jgi:hypothetical protein